MLDRLHVGSNPCLAARNGTASPFDKIELQRTPKRREITPRPRGARIHGAHGILQVPDDLHQDLLQCSYETCDGQHPARSWTTSTSRTSRDGDQQRTCSPRTRPGASPPTSPIRLRTQKGATVTRHSLFGIFASCQSHGRSSPISAPAVHQCGLGSTRFRPVIQRMICGPIGYPDSCALLEINFRGTLKTDRRVVTRTAARAGKIARGSSGSRSRLRGGVVGAGLVGRAVLRLEECECTPRRHRSKRSSLAIQSMNAPIARR
jgi:hypothetical protein